MMMMNINRLIFLTIFINLFQIQQINSYILNKSNQEIDCSKYDDDNHIIRSFSYFVERNPTVVKVGTSYVRMDEDFNVYSLTIVNEKSVPAQIYCFKYLMKLELVNMDSGGQFPVNIKYLPPSLIELGIYNTRIIEIPKDIGQLKNLETLILSNTGLMFLPDTIDGLISLVVLSLPDNNLQTLPKTIKNLPSLEKIFLINNPKLQSIESVNGLPSLKILEARKCSITTIPQNLPLLDELIMSNNNLTTLDGIETLGNGSSVSKHFYFNGNHIRSITPKIESVVNLHILNLEQNKLHGVPTNIYSVKTLVELNIKQNPIHRLSAILSRFSKALPNLIVLHD